MTATNIAHRECIIEHCTQNQNRINATTGYCLNHYRRWKRYGDPMQFYRSSGDTAAERFWSLTKPDGDCIIWQGSKNRKGYGRKKYDGTQRLVHHIAWHLTYGVYPKDCLLHSCDRPSCVNPKHLREGDHWENVRDRQSRQRQARGERHPFAKLTESQVRVIKGRLAQKERMTDIARDIGIGPTAIFAIKHGLSWSHIE